LIAGANESMRRIFGRRLNACVPHLLTNSPNNNRMSVAFSVEGNSGMDSRDPADAAAFIVLADRAKLASVPTAERHARFVGA
jgi:hypothetical protein